MKRGSIEIQITEDDSQTPCATGDSTIRKGSDNIEDNKINRSTAISHIEKTNRVSWQQLRERVHSIMDEKLQLITILRPLME
jgi:hypothetical protein